MTQCYRPDRNTYLFPKNISEYCENVKRSQKNKVLMVEQKYNCSSINPNTVSEILDLKLHLYSSHLNLPDLCERRTRKCVAAKFAKSVGCSLSTALANDSNAAGNPSGTVNCPLLNTEDISKSKILFFVLMISFHETLVFSRIFILTYIFLFRLKSNWVKNSSFGFFFLKLFWCEYLNPFTYCSLVLFLILFSVLLTLGM